MKNRTVLITQARTGSTRLPNKILLPIGEKTMLERFLDRVLRAETLDRVVVATTEAAADQAVVDLVTEKYGDRVAVFRGSEHDVLDRYYGAAKEAIPQEKRADAAIVRVTSDCPLIDPAVIDQMVTTWSSLDVDYCANRLSAEDRTWPLGMDVEVFSFNALGKAWEEASDPFFREHVTPYILRNPEKFSLKGIYAEEDRSDLRMTVDYREDLELMRTIYRYFGRDTMTIDELISWYLNNEEEWR
ncbi:MAG: glycosyltransferase family protein [bacterium]